MSAAVVGDRVSLYTALAVLRFRGPKAEEGVVPAAGVSGGCSLSVRSLRTELVVCRSSKCCN